MDMVPDVIDLCYPNMWMAKVDCADAFFHWALSEQMRDFMGIRHPITGEFYRYAYMPFGASFCPGVQQEIIAAIRDKMSQCKAQGGIDTLTKWFLDDGFIHGRTKKECLHRMLQVIAFLRKLGIEVKTKKQWALTKTLNF